MAPDAVDRDPEERCAEPLELRKHLLVQGHLIRADGAPVLRVEREDHRPPAELGERHGLVGTGAKCEFGRFRTRRERHRLFVNRRAHVVKT
jgi:hypothetical protein